MAIFEFDPRGLPKGFDRNEYYNRVKKELVHNYDIQPNDDSTIGAVVGILLLGEYFDSSSRNFDSSIDEARDELYERVPAVGIDQLPKSERLRNIELHTKDQVLNALRRVPAKVFSDAFRTIAKEKDGSEKIGNLLKDLTTDERNAFLDLLPDKALAGKLKKTTKKNFPGEFIVVTADQVVPMMDAATEKQIIRLLEASTKVEVFSIVRNFATSEIGKLLKLLMPGNDGEVRAKTVYAKIADTISTSSGKTVTFYQEFASVGRYIISRADEIPFGHPHFERQVEIGLDQYVSGAPTFDSLDLPPLTGVGGTDTEIIPDNINAASMVYAGYQLDVGMRMIDVVDRITEIFHNGQLPIGFDAGGKALDEYNWSAEDRLNALARRMHYSRVLGMSGGDVSKEVQPNTQFESLFLRFMSSLTEYDRQQRISDIVERERPRNLTSEYVRKAGRDLAANLSLYGWAATQFAARRIRKQIEDVLQILNQPSIQKAYGAQSLYQVIERVSALEFKSTPNIVKHRTMAEAGKRIIDLVAKYSSVWGRSDGTPLFSETINSRKRNGDIDDIDRDTFLSLTQQWLAVNGIKDAQVDEYAEPEISQYAPSIPSFGGFNGAMPANGNGGSPDQMDRIKEMVGQGQMPSLDQLQGMFKI